jgi:hypothetical protein
MPSFTFFTDFKEKRKACAYDEPRMLFSKIIEDEWERWCASCGFGFFFLNLEVNQVFLLIYIYKISMTIHLAC